MNRLSFLFCLILWNYCALYLQAQDVPFVATRIHQVAEMRPDRIYVLGAKSAAGQSVVMYNSINSSKRLEGVCINKDFVEEMNINATSICWRIKVNDDGTITLLHPSTGQYVKRVSSSSANLTWSQTQDESTKWRMKFNAQDELQLQDVGSERTLSLSSSLKGDTDVFLFANYLDNDSPALIVYGSKSGGGLPTITQGEAQMPADGAHVVMNFDQALLAEGGLSVSSRNYLLSDESVAASVADEAAVLTCKQISDNQFVLQNDEGATLGEDFTFASTPMTWQIQQGKVATVEEQPRYVYYDTTAAAWRLTVRTDVSTTPVFRSVAAAPKSSLATNGVLHLSGGWSAEQLSALSFDQVRCLDLTAMALPAYPLAFQADLSARNVPIFVPKAAQDRVPSTWRFAVSCSDAQRHLLFTTTLCDGATFFTDRNFHINRGQLIYQRPATASDVWQTLSLPFEASFTGADAYEVCGLDVDTLQLKVVYSLSCKGYLVRRYAGRPLVCESSETDITSFDSGSVRLLLPNYQPLVVTASDDSFYFFSSAQMQFMRAAPTSQLAPFRAYLKAPDNLTPARLRVRLAH